jgi:hypothetical protein
VNNDLTTGVLDPNLQLLSQHYNEGGPWTNSPPNQIFVTANDAYWLHWGLPDNGFSPLKMTALHGGTVTDIGNNIFLNGSEHWTKLAQSDLPGPNQGFFRMIDRPFSQLQILFPGETNAPNTVSGKVGTPNTINQNDLVTFTVNACDSAWHIVNVSGDMIEITTSGTDVLPNNPSLVSGSTTAQVQFTSAPGPDTVTAADVTNTNITSGVSTITIH